MKIKKEQQRTMGRVAVSTLYVVLNVEKIPQEITEINSWYVNIGRKYDLLGFLLLTHY